MDSSTNQEDYDLVEMLKMGQVEAFDFLFEKYSRNLYAFSKSLLKTHEDAEEVLQEVFLRVWNNRLQLLEQKSFKSFLFKLAVNVIVDKFRKRAKDQKYEQHVIHMARFNSFNPLMALEYEELNREVAKAIDELPEKRKRVYLLSRVEGFSYKEIAKRKDISTKTVESHINLAIKQICNKLGGRYRRRLTEERLSDLYKLSGCRDMIYGVPVVHDQRINFSDQFQRILYYGRDVSYFHCTCSKFFSFSPYISDLYSGRIVIDIK